MNQSWTKESLFDNFIDVPKGTLICAGYSRKGIMGRFISVLIITAFLSPSWARTPEGAEPENDPNNRIGLSERPQAASEMGQFYEGFGTHLTDEAKADGEGDGAFESASFESGAKKTTTEGTDSTK